MYLTSLQVTNFRCFERLEIEQLDRLAIIVGENDAGKTVVLDAIAILLGGSGCTASDYREAPDGTRATMLEISGTFRVEEHDSLPNDFRVGTGRDEFRLRRRFTVATAETYAWEIGFDDADYDDFKGAARQKMLLERADVVPASNEEGRLAQFSELVSNGTIQRSTPREKKLASATVLNSHLPRVDRISSAEYRAPDAMIQRTLQAIAASVLHPVDPVTGLPKEHVTLAALRGEVTKRLNEEIEKAKDVVQRVHPSLKGIVVTPTIDFTRAVTATPLAINTGEGDRLLGAFGEGTKKRLWMGLMDWETRVAKANVAGSLIRLYDEPDVNLAYQAQRHLFANISELACDKALQTQCVVCTHAVTFIDRAPCEAVSLIEVLPDGARRLQRIRSMSGPDVLRFFDEVGRAIGLSNSALLYERGFLLVEGDSETASLPTLYRTLYGRGMEEDGIVLINLYTCSAWRSVVEVMLSNRLNLTELLLDADCQAADSSARITPQTLAALGCPAGFATDHITFVGAKEFEDSFDDELIARALDADFPREDKSDWLPEISALRAAQLSTSKFSDELKRKVRGACAAMMRSEATKPKIAASLASHCSKGEVPLAVRDAFERVRARASAGTSMLHGPAHATGSGAALAVGGGG